MMLIFFTPLYTLMDKSKKISPDGTCQERFSVSYLAVYEGARHIYYRIS